MKITTASVIASFREAFETFRLKNWLGVGFIFAGGVAMEVGIGHFPSFALAFSGMFLFILGMLEAREA